MATRLIKIRTADSMFGIRRKQGTNHTAADTFTDLLNQIGNEKIWSKLGRHWSQYTTGLNDIIRVRNPTQETLLNMWGDRFIESAEIVLGELFREYDVPMSFYVNIINSKRAQMIEQGKIYEKLAQK